MTHTLKDVLPHSALVAEDGHLHIGGVDVVELAAEHGTPLYVLCERTLRERCTTYRESLPGASIYYASKAFLCTEVARIVAEEGLNLDVASGGELFTALRAGVDGERLIMHGNNKSDAELRMAVENGVGRIVADSIEELERIDATAGALSTRQRVLLRVTPGVEAHTHEYVQTGQEDSKFGMSIEGGVALEAVKRAKDLDRIHVGGFHCHIGSNITGVEAFLKTVEIMGEFLGEVRDETGIEAEELNLGGGLGIAYTREDPPARVELFAREVAAAVEREALKHSLPQPKLSVEPGRWLVANAMVTIYSVGTVKEIPGVRTYVAVDGGMSDNIRPALYGARYEAFLANKANEQAGRVVTIAGAHCEQGDLLIRDIALPESVQRGDLLAIPATGAYGYSMASNYNKFLRPPVVAVMNGAARVIVRRETYEDLVRLDA
ncbi:MAG TPA: diaminopimelate decarboxylase [Actinomycetota bacterium]|nr:diaminopimelate decarboxylase [Actinomycetota bacterium]